MPVVAFRRCPNLRDLLVSAKLLSNSTNPNPQLPCGSFRCGKNCATCPYISDGLTSYTFFSTGETRTIKSNLTCDTKSLIYMIQCNRCNLQYIGETKRRLKDRFNEHRRTINNPNTKSKPASLSAIVFRVSCRVSCLAGAGDTSGRMILSFPSIHCFTWGHIRGCVRCRTILSEEFCTVPVFKFLSSTTAVSTHFSRFGIKRSASPLAFGQYRLEIPVTES